MRSIRSLFLFGIFVLSFHGAVEARDNNNAAVHLPANPAKRVPPRGGGSRFETETLAEATTRGMRRLLLRGANGGDRTLAQKQEWARNDDGELLWWIWLIVGLSIALCCFVCCCSSACCLRD